MSLTAGQKQYLLELLSHEYLLTAEQQPLVRQAVCRYATAVYDQQELDFLVTLPQSLAICLYYQCSKHAFARQYGLWLNCLEHSIFQEIDGLEAIVLNPDPTGCEKLLAIIRQQDESLKVIPLPELAFRNQPQGVNCSRWSWWEARESMDQFLQYAHSGAGCQQQSEPLTWSDLLQQARLFSMVKENYQFAGYDQGLPQPSGWQQLQQLPSAQKHRPAAPHGWIYQPPVNPFSAQLKGLQQMKQHFSNWQPRPLRLPAFPAPPHIPFAPFSNKRK